MKVSELRQLLKASDRECLEKAFVESYKTADRLILLDLSSLQLLFVFNRRRFPVNRVGTAWIF